MRQMWGEYVATATFTLLHTTGASPFQGKGDEKVNAGVKFEVQQQQRGPPKASLRGEQGS